jgi:hypothetical protein
MRAGIIAEGKSDIAVIINILKGKLGIDRSDIQPISPELELDETDLSTNRPEQFSNWTIVKQKCLEGKTIHEFLNTVEDTRFLIIHLDAAERNEVGYQATVPENGSVTDIRLGVSEKIKEWLGDHWNERISFAVAVEETDAWLIPLYDNRVNESGILPNAKERLTRLIQKSHLFTSDPQAK